MVSHICLIETHLQNLILRAADRHTVRWLITSSNIRFYTTACKCILCVHLSKGVFEKLENRLWYKHTKLIPSPFTNFLSIHCTLSSTSHQPYLQIPQVLLLTTPFWNLQSLAFLPVHQRQSNRCIKPLLLHQLAISVSSHHCGQHTSPT